MIPAWLEDDVIPVDRAVWLEGEGWRGVRVEPRRVAASFIANGFTDDGTQIHPKALSAIAADAGASVASAKRFLRLALIRGLLARTGRSASLAPGRQRTPFYRLTKPGPGFGVPYCERVPASLRDELAALAALGGGGWQSCPWDEPGQPPEWVDGINWYGEAAAA